jgi:hypothetical protein
VLEAIASLSPFTRPMFRYLAIYVKTKSSLFCGTSPPALRITDSGSPLPENTMKACSTASDLFARAKMQNLHCGERVALLGHVLLVFLLGFRPSGLGGTAGGFFALLRRLIFHARFASTSAEGYRCRIFARHHAILITACCSQMRSGRQLHENRENLVALIYMTALGRQVSL